MSWYSDNEPFNEWEQEYCKRCNKGFSKAECDRCQRRHEGLDDDEEDEEE